MTTPDEKPSQTQVINLEDVDVSAVASERSLPPPLPPELPSVSQMPPALSLPPPAPRSGMFYAVLILGFVVVGLAGGIAATVLMRAPEPSPDAAAAAAAAEEPQAAPVPAPVPSSAVMTLPTIDMNDDVDGGS